MKNLTPLSALFLIACGTSAPSTSSDTAPTSVGSAAEAIRQLGKNDADVVAKCEQLVKRCAAFAGDSGAGSAVCDKIGAHCADLAEQLSEARDQFQECLEGVATCEASATSRADCAAERAACNPAGKDFEDRRGATLSCAERTQSCLPRGRGPGARGNDDDDNDDDDNDNANADAGAQQCDDNAMDFVGCCHGQRGGRGAGAGAADAGAGRPFPFGPGRGAGFSGPGMTPRPADDHDRGNNADDDADDTGGDSDDGNR
ncbi:MAG: hypothetical protein ABI895_03960 [Deltaproteobacteria bacterium]